MQTDKLGMGSRSPDTKFDSERTSAERGGARRYWLDTDKKLITALAIAGSLVSISEIIPFVVAGEHGVHSKDAPCDVSASRFVHIGVLGEFSSFCKTFRKKKKRNVKSGGMQRRKLTRRMLLVVKEVMCMFLLELYLDMFRRKPCLALFSCHLCTITYLLIRWIC